MTEKVLYTKTVFSGKVLSVSRDAIQMETGAETIREIVHHPGGACIAAVSDDYDVYMVRQPRYAFHEKLLELPAGKLEAGEDPEIAARRELAEEVGPVSYTHLDVYKRQVRLLGHAIECRINAEDTDKNFMPSIGRIDVYKRQQV